MHTYKKYTISRKTLKKKKKYTGLKLLLWILIIGIVFVKYLYGNIHIPSNEIIVKRGDTLSSIIADNLSSKERFFFKIYKKIHPISDKIYPWTHQFSGTTLSKNEFIKNIQSEPEIAYIKFTVLEWRSSYDIDATLTERKLISKGEYLAYIQNKENIETFFQNYPFLQESRKWWKTLEGYLYPDTYHLRPEKIIIDLVKGQLQAFNTKVRKKHSKQLKDSVLGIYGTLNMASIVEREEKNNVNKPTVAAILMKREYIWTVIGADISLCYYYKKTHKTCTPEFIHNYVEDTSNPYNTRKNRGLPPTAIGNPSIETILAVLNHTKTDYFYYLHWKDGQIHYAKTLQQHNANLKYL